MTENTFAAKVTEIIDAATGWLEYPDCFDSDVHACFQNRMTPEEAADKLLSEWQEEEEQEEEEEEEDSTPSQTDDEKWERRYMIPD